MWTSTHSLRLRPPGDHLTNSSANSIPRYKIRTHAWLVPLLGGVHLSKTRLATNEWLSSYSRLIIVNNYWTFPNQVQSLYPCKINWLLQLLSNIINDPHPQQFEWKCRWRLEYDFNNCVPQWNVSHRSSQRIMPGGRNARMRNARGRCPEESANGWIAGEGLYFGMWKLQSELFREHFHRKQLDNLGRGVINYGNWRSREQLLPKEEWTTAML